MRVFLSVLAATCLLSFVTVASLADDKDTPTSVTGILIDQACGAKMMDKDDPEKAAADHPKSCAMKEACEKSGYAVISGKKMWKFNAKGNILAKDYLKKTDKTSDIRVKVDGVQKGDEIEVDAITVAK
ncbi:MAG TPA: hypothetical protein VG326_20410 [Tepidisphaeraceae bacterium]|jgi:hypothetical protein|nr:hypothetical protein [Tepidisphaeraceae bacterium]